MKILFLILIFSFNSFAQSSMRRCTLLPITDSVGGAIGFKVFEQLEKNLKQSHWCTYVSNSGLIGIFSKYRENLNQHLKEKDVLKTVAEKLKVGSLLRINLISELKGVEVQLEVNGEDGEDLYFSEKTLLASDDVDLISQTVINWLEMYSKMIPYDAKINGILGDQITLDVGKGYPIKVGQEFVVKRPTQKRKHPLLKKIVDWDSDVLAEGKIFNISENQALGMVKVYKTDRKLSAGDWVRLTPVKQDFIEVDKIEEKVEENPGSLGIVSLALFTSSASVDNSTATGSNRMSGYLYGFDFRGEGWLTRQYFGILEVSRSIGKLSKASGSPDKSSINSSFGKFKLMGGYKYLPIGFFYGPQVDIYGGWANYLFDLDYSANDGFGQTNISGVVLGVAANVPINREYRFSVRADFIPFPTFKDSDSIYSSSESTSAMNLEVGLKYQYTPRMTLDGGLETLAAKGRFNSSFKEISYHDNLKLKFGASFNY